MTAPLSLRDIRVFEIGHSVSAPFGAVVLAGLGAEVIKVEHPSKGDPTRDWGPPYHDETAVLFESINRDKKSVTVNLKDPDAVNRLRTLILNTGDVVIQNLRPGVSDELGIGARELTTAKDSLIYCNISAYGHKGPYRDRPGYDPVMQAFGGLMSITGEEKRPPVRVGAPIIDMGAGMWSVIGILSALLERQKTGKGTIVDTSLFETSLSWMTFPLSTYLASGEVPVRFGSAVPQVAPYEVFRTSDNYLMIAAGNDNLFRKLSVALGQSEWSELPEFSTNGKRVENRNELIPKIAEIVAGKTTLYWAGKLDTAGIPNAPIQSTDAVADSEQTKSLEMIQHHPALKSGLPGLPISFNGERLPLRTPPPSLGEANSLLDDVKKPDNSNS